MTEYEKGQNDLIEQIKNDIAAIEQTSKPDMFIVDLLSLLKNLKPIQNERV